MSRQTTATSWIVAAVVVLAVVAVGIFLARRAMHRDSPSATIATARNARAQGASSTSRQPIQHPIEMAQGGPASASTVALPALPASDGDVAAALVELAGGDRLHAVLVPRQIIARMVATLDALPRHDGLGVFMLPVQTPKGAFTTTIVDGTPTISTQNAARYAPYMALLEHTDPRALVAWYVRAYPLFQAAYQQLGYPHGYFNDRLLVVIDDLLAAPEPAHPAALHVKQGYYTYADPALESLSTGQKLLLRVGPTNAVRIKAKLREIRIRLVGQIPPTTRSATSATQ
ncbi:MAG: DUF3014 domain-containing protein [Rhodanobacter sp.]